MQNQLWKYSVHKAANCCQNVSIYCMRKILFLLVILQTFAHYGKAQTNVEPYIGWQKDLNSSVFKQLNTGVQLNFKESPAYEFILQLQRSWPMATVSYDSAFTTNTDLPVYASAKKIIKPAAFSFAIGHRITVAGKNTANVFNIIIYTGIRLQGINVKYKYDRDNYTILNPDKTIIRTGFYVSGGAEYMRLLKNGRIFFQLAASTESLHRKIKYPASFNFLAPLSFNTGYSFNIKKNK